VRHPVHGGCLLLKIGFALLQRVGVRHIAAMAATSRCRKRASRALRCCPTNGALTRTEACDPATPAGS
jgi:hypothetical protein